MLPYIGDFVEDATVYHYFNTFDSNDPSASVTITNLADTDIYVYKDGSVTDLVTDGASVVIDFDARTGVHKLTIDTSVSADYSTGSDYMVLIEGTTVDGGTITAGIFTFSIENRYQSAPTAAAVADAVWDEDLSTGHAVANSAAVRLSDTLVDTNSLNDTKIPQTLNLTASGNIGIDWANVENPTTAVDLSATDIQLADTVTTLTGHTAQTGDTYALANGAAGFVAIDTVVDAILVDTGTTLETHLTDIKGATFSGSTDSLEAIRDRGDAEWVTGAGGSPPQLLQSTTIATLASQTSFTLTAGSADNDAYNDAVVVVTDQTTATQKAVGSVSDYVGSTKTVTLLSDPGIFTMAVGDTIDIIANASTAPTASAVADAVWDEDLSTGHAVSNSAAVRLSDILVDTGTDGVVLAADQGVDVVKISGDSSAADNLEAMYDGTGYDNDKAPATQEDVAGIGSGGTTALNFPVSADNTSSAINGVTKVGTPTGTFANTESNPTGSYHTIAHTADDIDWVYEIDVGDTKTATSVVIDAYLTGNGDTINVEVWDHVGADWETFYTLNGTNGSANTEIVLSLFGKHTGAIGSSNPGLVWVRFDDPTGTAPTLNVGRIVTAAVTSTSTMGYESGQVWVNEGAGTSTGTTLGVDGTFANQCDDFDNGQTIADSLGTSFIHNHPGTSVTLTAALQGYNISNVQCTLTGGSQNADSTRVNGGFIAGTWTRAGTGIMTFVGCQMNNVTSARCAILGGSGLVGTFTLSEAGLYPLVDCQAAGATGITTIDFASQNGATVNMERWSGNLTITNMAASDTLNLHATSGGDIILGGVGGTVYISGTVGSVTDNRTGSPTLTDESTTAQITTVDSVVDDILADTADMQPKLGTPSADLATDIAATATPAEVATEISDALNVDTTTAPTGPPSATAPLGTWIVWLGTLARNKMTFNKTTGVHTLRNDADSADVASSTAADDGTTVTRPKWS